MLIHSLAFVPSPISRSPARSPCPSPKPKTSPQKLRAFTVEGGPNSNAPHFFSDSPNARSKTVTTAEGLYTHGVLNQHPSQPTSYQIGVAEDKGVRRTMEDAYSFVVDFAGVRGQGFFAIFDGHAGKHAAEWCGQHFHEHLLDTLQTAGTGSNVQIPDVLNKTFHAVDSRLSKMAQEDKTHSGCTAVTAFLRLEDKDGGQSFLDGLKASTTAATKIRDSTTATAATGTHTRDSSVSQSQSDSIASPTSAAPKERESTLSGGLKNLMSSITRSPSKKAAQSPRASTASSARTSPRTSTSAEQSAAPRPPRAVTPPPNVELRRVLYTANAGDARAVLCRAGKAVRLTYDHKGSDRQEAKRIMDAGGFVMNNRVNGVLAVTRALGDSSMKDFVVGAPYTTETELSEEDEFLIIACDGLWDVAEDQQAVDLVRPVRDAQEATEKLLKHAMNNFSTDNVTVLVVRLDVGPKKE
ncbi:protein serine/threonine phosphatase 2C [Auriculariales sp. MPI-PUGE-AT-0066]|nr:protein serine/threonine phosphatase 2C [Auriculariales sp. MPI-PUGE-AT-0066]